MEKYLRHRRRIIMALAGLAFSGGLVSHAVAQQLDRRLLGMWVQSGTGQTLRV